jgi:hypothetical protein
MSLFLGTPGTPGLESRNCPETVPRGVPGLWELITLDCGVWSQRGLNQTCSPRRDLFNDVSHSRFGGWEEVDSRLLVVGSQTGSLTPGPSFAHNLGYRCPNGQCEAIFYIYASRPFQWHQEHLNARCFRPCCRALNIRESRKTPNPHFFQVLGFTPTLGQSRVATKPNNEFTFKWHEDVKRTLKDYQGTLEDLDKVDVFEPNNAFTLWKHADVKIMLEDCRRT